MPAVHFAAGLRGPDQVFIVQGRRSGPRERASAAGAQGRRRHTSPAKSTTAIYGRWQKARSSGQIPCGLEVVVCLGAGAGTDASTWIKRVKNLTSREPGK